MTCGRSLAGRGESRALKGGPMWSSLRRVLRHHVNLLREILKRLKKKRPFLRKKRKTVPVVAGFPGAPSGSVATRA